MSDTLPRPKLPAFITNRERSHIYYVLAAYAEAGIGVEHALEKLARAYAELQSSGRAETTRLVAVLAEKYAESHDLANALLSAFDVTAPEERALLAGLAEAKEGRGMSVLLSRAADYAMSIAEMRGPAR